MKGVGVGREMGWGPNDVVGDEGRARGEAVDDQGAGAVHAGRNDGVVGPRGVVEGHQILPAAVELRGAKGLRARRVVDGKQDGGCHDHACTVGSGG